MAIIYGKVAQRIGLILAILVSGSITLFRAQLMALFTNEAAVILAGGNAVDHSFGHRAVSDRPGHHRRFAARCGRRQVCRASDVCQRDHCAAGSDLGAVLSAESGVGGSLAVGVPGSVYAVYRQLLALPRSEVDAYSSVKN